MGRFTWIPWMVQTVPALYDLSLVWQWWDSTFPQHQTGSALYREPTCQQMHQHLLQILLSSSRCSEIQGISYPTSGSCTPVLFFPLIFLLCVFWSLLVQWVLRGINDNFHPIQSSSHPESGLAFCQMQQLRRVQSKLQRWKFWRVLGLPVVSCRGAE